MAAVVIVAERKFEEASVTVSSRSMVAVEAVVGIDAEKVSPDWDTVRAFHVSDAPARQLSVTEAEDRESTASIVTGTCAPGTNRWDISMPVTFGGSRSADGVANPSSRCTLLEIWEVGV
jgi:hypothetical protein